MDPAALDSKADKLALLSPWKLSHPCQHGNPAALVGWHRCCAVAAPPQYHAPGWPAATQVYAIDFDTARDAIPALRKKVPGVK